MSQTSVDLTPCCIKHTHLSPSGTDISRLDMCRFIILLSKIAHQMWWDQVFNQRNKTTERAVGLGVGGDREGGQGGGGEHI